MPISCHFCHQWFQLAPDDAWRCPHCKQLQQGSIKLSLWTLPDILILHLKRFRQVLLSRQSCRNWSSWNFIMFKCLNFRMEINEWRFRTWWSSLSSVWTWRRTWWREARAAGVSRLTGRHGDDLTGWAETQRTTFMTCMQCAITMGPCKEDITQVSGSEHPVLCVCCWLIGLIMFVCCFIAHCKNSIDGQWYCFDDSDVHPISEDDVCKQTGYILFYQRRATVPSWSANSSVGGNCLVLWWRISGIVSYFEYH